MRRLDDETQQGTTMFTARETTTNSARSGLVLIAAAAAVCWRTALTIALAIGVIVITILLISGLVVVLHYAHGALK
jgi:hypothetical protein